MLKSFVLIIIGLVLYLIHTYSYLFSIKATKPAKDTFIVPEEIAKNIHIQTILERMSYIKKYNSSVYDNLQSVLTSLLALYYRYINDEDVVINDVSYYKQQLDKIYEELSLNLPYRYHKRLRRDIKSINEELNKKIELIKIKSFKSPIKISLMNYNYNAK